LKQAYLHKIVSLPRFNKRLIIFVVDVLLIVTALLASFSLRLGEWYWPSGEIFWLVVGAPVVALPLLTYLGLYQIVIRYIGLDALWLAARAVSLYALIWGACLVFFGGDGVPYSVILINWTIVILLIVGSRIIAQWWVLKVLDYAKTIVDTNECKNVVIYGAGEAGAQLATILVYAHGLHPVAPIVLVGRTALSVDINTNVSTLAFIAACTQCKVPKILFRTPSAIFNSTIGTCLYAAV